MLKDARSMILAAAPTRPSELRTVFSEKPGSIRRNLEQPPVLRENGWSLRTSDQAKFVHGELIRVEGHRAIVDLYRDGALIFGGQINSEFLAWSDKGDLDIHPLALVEVIVNFTRFYGLVLDDFRETPERVAFTIELRNLHLAGQKNRLPEGPVGENVWWKSFTTFREAPGDTWKHEIQISSDSFDPDQVAYRLARELYIWFGHAEEAIPYLKGDGDTRAVDADQIAAIGRRVR